MALAAEEDEPAGSEDGGDDDGDDDPETPRGGQGAAADENPERVAGSNSAVAKYCKNKNAILVVVSTIADPKNVSLLDALTSVSEPLDRAHGRTLKMGMSVDGSLKWHCEMATAPLAYLDKMLSVCCNRNTVASWGLLLSPAAGAASVGLGRRERKEVVGGVLAYLQHVVGLEILFCGLYQYQFPLWFAALLDDNPDHVFTALGLMRIVWEALLRAEVAAQTNPWMATFLEKLLWPRCIWAREVLVALSETKWACVPSDITAELRRAFAGFGTKDVEDAFNLLRRQARFNLAGKLNPATQWHHVNFGGLIEASGGVSVQIANCDQLSTARAIPRRCFQATSHYTRFSLGKTCLQELMRDRNNFTTVDRLQYLDTTMLTSALSWSGGDAELLQLVWLSQLLQPGMLCVDREHRLDHVVYWVLRTTPSGVAALVGDVKNCAGKNFIAWRRLAEDGCKFIHIHDVSQWFVYTHEPADPHSLMLNAGAHGATEIPLVTFELIWPEEPLETLLRAMARRAFVGTTVPFMQRLIRHLEVMVEGRRPTTEMDVLRVLIKHVLPDISEDDMNAILALRRQKKASQFVSVLETASGELLDEAADQDLRQSIDEEVTKSAAKRRGATNASTSGAPGASTASASSSSAPAVAPAAPTEPPVPEVAVPPAVGEPNRERAVWDGVRRPIEGEEFQAEAVRRYLPPGATISIYCSRAWKVKYPEKLRAPFSKTATWSAREGHKQCLIQCLRWAWDAHTERTGEECEWDLA